MSAALTMSLGTPLVGDTLTALVAYALVVTVIPGSNNLCLLSAGLDFGLRRSGWHLLGILWGTYLVIYFVGMVLGALFVAAPGVQAVLRYAAGFYMLWLASRFWRTDALPVVPGLQPVRFGEAVLLQLGNPRAWLVATAVIVGFVPAGERYLERMLSTALVFCLAALPGTALWAMRGARLHAWMHTPSHLRRLQLGTAATTAAAAFLFWT